MTSGDWPIKGDKLFEVLAAHEKPVVILFDELPILVNRLLKGPDYVITAERRGAADTFLSWLRSNSIRHQGKIRIVVAGSIGLEPVVHQGGLSATLNTLAPFHLGAWSPEVAAGCLRALANGYGLSLGEEAIQEMIERLGVCIPHHVQMFFDYVYQASRLRGLSQVSRSLAADVYQESMLGTRGHVELSHLEERLKMVLGPKVDLLALDLLTEAAVTGSVSADAATILAQDHFREDWGPHLREVLGILEHDGYLQNQAGTYTFVSRLLRDWWKARFEFTYVPASRRGGRS